jgi:WD40 repeat protein
MSNSQDPEILLWLLASPVIPRDFPPELLYRTACCGAVAVLSETVEKSSEEEQKIAVEILKRAVLQAAAENIQKLSLEALTRAASNHNIEAIRAIFDLAIQSQNENAIIVLDKYDFQLPFPEQNSTKYFILKNKAGLTAVDPDLFLLTKYFLNAPENVQQRLILSGKDTYPNWAKIAGFLQSLLKGDYAAGQILNDYGSFSEREKSLLIDTITTAFPSQNAIVADLFLRYGDPVSLNACLAYQILPQNRNQNALFFFLSEQWTLYSENDFEFRKIRNAFSEADDTLKRKLIEVSRKSGNVGWLREFDTSAQFHTDQSALSLSQWFELIHLLIENHNFQRLWEILPIVPLCYTQDIFKTLKSVAFSPENSEEKAFFLQIGSLFNTNPVRIPVPLAQRYYTQKTKPIQLCLNSASDHLAAAFLNDSIQVWNIKDRRIPPMILNGGNSGFRSISFSNEGSYLAAADYDNGVQIFQIPSGKMIKRIQAHKNPVTGLFISNDDKKMFTVDNTGVGSIWGFPHGTKISEFDCHLESIIRLAYNPETGQIILISRNGNLTIFDPQKNQRTTSFMTIPDNLILGQNNRNGLITCVSSNNQVSCWNLVSERPITETIIPDISGRILSALDIVSGETCVFGSQSGKCEIYELFSGRKLVDIRNNEKAAAVSALQINSDHSSLFLAGMDGEITRWDLTLFNWFTRSFKILKIPSMKQIDDFAHQYKTQPVANALELMKTILEWRCRFDIEIEFEI